MCRTMRALGVSLRGKSHLPTNGMAFGRTMQCVARHVAAQVATAAVAESQTLAEPQFDDHLIILR